METAEEVLRQIQEGNGSPLEQTGGFSADETLEAILSGRMRKAPNPFEYTNTNDLPTLAGAVGLGAANMVNSTVLGGLGLMLSPLGRAVEYISPYSGEINQETVDNLRRAGVSEDIIAKVPTYEDSWLTTGAKGALAAQNYIEDKYLNKWRSDILGDNPTNTAQVMEGLGSVLGYMALGALGNAYLGPLGAAAFQAVGESLS